MEKIASLAQTVCSNLNSLGEKIAIVIEGKEYSYNFLKKNVYSLSESIKKQSNVGERIGLQLQNNIECYIGLLALLVSGRTFVPINEGFGQNQIIQIIDNAHLTKIIQTAETEFFKNLREQKNFQVIPFEEPLNRNVELISAEEAYILFTSGSTGKPKGVPIPHKNLNCFIHAMTKESSWSLSKNDSFLQPFDLSFDLFVICVYLPLFLGAKFYTTPSEKRALHSAALLESEDISVSMLVPSSMKIINKISSDLTFNSLRLCFFCGETLFVSDLKTWMKQTPNAKQINIYGPTEGTVVCMQYVWNENSETEIDNGIVPIGKAFGLNKIELKETENGNEIFIEGPQVFPGYIGTDLDPFFIKKDQRFYKTGDLCSVNEKGNLVFLGRKDEQVKIDGYRIELADVENKLKKLFVDRQTVVIVKTNEENISTLHAFISGSKIDDIKQLLRSSLPAYMIPSSLNFIGSIPLNINGKTDRKKLKSLL